MPLEASNYQRPSPSLLRGAHFYSVGFLLIGGQNFDDLAHHRLWRPAGTEDIGIFQPARQMLPQPR